MSRIKDGDKTQQESACAACDRPDYEEDMVACDSCDVWFHFSCAEVDETVSNQPWKCISCGGLNQTSGHVDELGGVQPQIGGTKKLLEVPSIGRKSSKALDINKPSTSTKMSKKPTTRGSVSATSSVKNRAIEIEIKMLEEQERIKEQELREEIDMKQKKLRFEEKMRDRELELEARRLAEEKSFQEKQLADVEHFRKVPSEMRQLSIKKRSRASVVTAR